MTCARDIISTKTSCPYCGVGCGVKVSIDAQKNVSVKGDETHPANFGKLCSKGSALGETLGVQDRLLDPKIKGESVTWDTALDEIATKFSKIIEKHGPDAVAFYVSGQLLTEDYYVANKLMKGYIGSANIDTNSRLCMASSVVGHKRAFGADSVPGCYEDLELADLLVLTGSNLAWCHPILYQRIMSAKAQRPEMKIIVIDPRKTASCDLADLHLPLAPGSDVALFQGVFNFLNSNGFRDETFVENHTENFEETQSSAQSYDVIKVSGLTDLPPELLEEFYTIFAESKKVVTIYSQGVNQAHDGTDKVNAIINCHLLTGRIGKPGTGPFSVTGQPNAMGGREVGGLSNQLASHMDLENPAHRDLVKRYWGSPEIADKPGLKAVDLFDAVHAGKVKAIWIMATNPVVSMPNANHVKAALQKCDLVVVSDIYGHTDTVACADIVLPSSAWGEKGGTVTNSERRISRQRAFAPPPGQARHDWWQLCEVGKRMGFVQGFDFKGVADIFAEYAGLCAFENDGTRDLDLSALTDMSVQDYEELAPIQWPVTTEKPHGTARVFEDNQYFTPSGKARFVPPARTKKRLKSTRYPLVLNTGRIRDHWHTMTRTARSSRLSQHICEPFVELHPSDAKGLDLDNADIACLETAFGKMYARVKVTDTQKQRSIFVPMHFTDRYASLGRVDTLVHSAVDPLSGQPAFKSTPVKASKFKASWYGFAVIKTNKLGSITPPRAAEYWAKAPVAKGIRMEMAGQRAPESWAETLSTLLNKLPNVDVLELRSPVTGQVSFAAFHLGVVVALLYVADTPVRVSRDWACAQLSTAPLGAQRYKLLAGRPGADMPDKGAIICSCMQVGLFEIKEVIRRGCTSVFAIGDATTAGTNCGSCQPEIRNLLKETALVAAE